MSFKSQENPRKPFFAGKFSHLRKIASKNPCYTTFDKKYMRRIRTEMELGDALREDTDRIEIEGDLSKKVFIMRATGKIAWAVFISYSDSYHR
jgi:hypothetical protein